MWATNTEHPVERAPKEHRERKNSERPETGVRLSDEYPEHKREKTAKGDNLRIADSSVEVFAKRHGWRLDLTRRR